MLGNNNNEVAGSPLSGGGDSNGAMNNKIKVYLSDYKITNTKGYKFSISTLLSNLCSENSPLLSRVIHYSRDLESMVEKAAATLMAHGE